MTLILGIETSCDETAAAVVQDGWLVRSNIIATQHRLHEQYGGVVPEIASRAHLERISPVIQQALKQADRTLDQLDAIAVGNRPGLIGSLLIGVGAAKTLAWSTGKPLIGVDHVLAHLYAPALINAWDVNESANPAPNPIQYPAIGLVVSGGHTSLYELVSPTEITRLGRTIDDAVGEAYDKAAVILNLGYPGGPNLDRLAQQGDPSAYDLPRSMLSKQSLDFSFSGLKTALLYAVRGLPKRHNDRIVFERSADDLTEAQRTNLAAAFQQAAIDALMIKLHRGLDRMTELGRPTQSLIVGGGVSANSLLRRRAKEMKNTVTVRLANVVYCLDNAAMIAGLAHHCFVAGQFDDLDLPALATSRC